jgi:tyrosyl-tRNA synthetase
MNLYEELQARGLVDRVTSDEIIEKMNAGELTFYVGFDPTADSLHVGHFAMFNLMRLMQKAGNQPIGLMGGATGSIGDPSGKSAERNLQTLEQIDANIQAIRKQAERFLDFKDGAKAKLVNNHDWFSQWSYINFLRDIGKHFSVNAMIARDSVKSRIEREGEGISYTEFSYMILQAYDFYYLNEHHGCNAQLGGSDQWGNIVSGIDLTRRMNQNQVFGMTMPLVTKADGKKFGKSESGTVWMDPTKTSPFEFYQFFVRQADEDVIRLIKFLTTMPFEEIQEVEEAVKNEPHLRRAQVRLAEEVTTTVHGKAELEKVLRASKILYGGSIEDVDDATLREIFADVPSFEKDGNSLSEGWSLVDALAESGACKSKGQARKLIQSGGVYVNNEKVQDHELVLKPEHKASENTIVLRTGKKNYTLISFI